MNQMNPLLSRNDYLAANSAQKMQEQQDKTNSIVANTVGLATSIASTAISGGAAAPSLIGPLVGLGMDLFKRK